ALPIFVSTIGIIFKIWVHKCASSALRIVVVDSRSFTEILGDTYERRRKLTHRLDFNPLCLGMETVSFRTPDQPRDPRLFHQSHIRPVSLTLNGGLRAHRLRGMPGDQLDKVVISGDE